MDVTGREGEGELGVGGGEAAVYTSVVALGLVRPPPTLQTHCTLATVRRALPIPHATARESAGTVKGGKGE